MDKDSEDMMPNIGVPRELAEVPEASRKAFAALMAALTSGCECEACRILRSMADDLKAGLLG